MRINIIVVFLLLFTATAKGQLKTESTSYPNVKLESIDRLEPYKVSTVDNNKLYIGHIVHNLTQNATLSEGNYRWNGTEWQSYSETEVTKLEPWMDVETGKMALENDRAAYLLGKAITGSDHSLADAQLYVHGDAVLNGQTALGENGVVAKGALLNFQTGEASASGGLVLPRVILENMYTLQPFIQLDDQDWSASYQEKTKARHKGLLIYHLGSDNLPQGEYIWNGKSWNREVVVADNIPSDGQFFLYNSGSGAGGWTTVAIPTVNKGDLYQYSSTVARDTKGISLPRKTFEDTNPYHANQAFDSNWIVLSGLNTSIHVPEGGAFQPTKTINRLSINFQTGIQTYGYTKWVSYEDWLPTNAAQNYYLRWCAAYGYLNPNDYNNYNLWRVNYSGFSYNEWVSSGEGVLTNGWISYGIGVFISPKGKNDFKLKLVRTATLTGNSEMVFPTMLFTLKGAIDNLLPGDYDLRVAVRRRNQAQYSTERLAVGQIHPAAANDMTNFEMQSFISATLYMIDD